MVSPPSALTTLPYLIIPTVFAVLILWLAWKRGATWTQVQVSFVAALLGAFLTAGGWLMVGFLVSKPLPLWRLVLSELLVAACCGVVAFFGMMPQDHELQ